MKKVAIFINSMTGGGAERIVSYLLQEGYQRYDIHLILLHRIIEYNLPPGDAIRVVELEKEKVSKWASVLRMDILAKKLRDYLEEHKIETVLSLLNRPNLIACRAKKMGWKGNLIISERADTLAYYKTIRFGWYMIRLVRKYYPYADTVTAISKGIAMSLGKLGIDKVKVIYNPIKLNEVGQDAVKNERFTFINVARMEPQKNHALLIKAFAALNEANSQLVIVGKGFLEDKLVSLATALGVQDRIIFTGFQKDIYPFLQKANCFVFSSDFEGLGNVIIEALAVGLPVISTDCPFGPREILSPSSPTGMIIKDKIDNAEFGILTPVGNEALLVDAMRRIMNDARLRTGYEIKAKGRAEDFNIKKIMEEYFSLF